MSRPTLEVADIVRRTGNSFWEQQQAHLAWPHRKVLDAIVRCRTAALGGHRDQCVRCGHQAISFNSCRNRHCPKCQGNARAKWLTARSAELEAGTALADTLRESRNRIEGAHRRCVRERNSVVGGRTTPGAVTL